MTSQRPRGSCHWGRFWSSGRGPRERSCSKGFSPMVTHMARRDDVPGYVEGSLARIVEAAAGDAPDLPSVKTDHGVSVRAGVRQPAVPSSRSSRAMASASRTSRSMSPLRRASCSSSTTSPSRTADAVRGHPASYVSGSSVISDVEPSGQRKLRERVLERFLRSRRRARRSRRFRRRRRPRSGRPGRPRRNAAPG